MRGHATPLKMKVFPVTFTLTKTFPKETLKTNPNWLFSPTVESGYLTEQAKLSDLKA